MKNYKDKTVLITGASSGIGESFAKQLDELGSKLILTARSEDKLNKLASQMNDAIVISGDLSDRKFPKKLYKEVKNKKLTVDIIINNAGFGYSGPFLDSEFSGYEEMLNLNVYSLMELTYLFMNDMLKKKEWWYNKCFIIGILSTFTLFCSLCRIKILCYFIFFISS